MFTETPHEETARVRDSYLIASSYTPLYGMLKENGHWLYFVSPNDAKDYLFDLPENSAAINKPVTASIRPESEPMIRRDILALERFCHFQPPP